MNQPSLNFVEQLVIAEVREQLRNLPSSFRQYLSEIKIDRVMNNAIQILPRSFKTLGEKYHDYHPRRLRIKGSSVCVMQWTGVIRDETLIETDITAIFVNCLRSGAN
jgi:hypothetical protein